MALHIGVAGGPLEMLEQFIGTGVFEVVLTHNRFTLVDRSAEGLIDKAAGAGVGVVNAAVFGGGILAKGTGHSDRYAYRPAGTEVLGRIRAMEEACARHGVSLRRRRSTCGPGPTGQLDDSGDGHVGPCGRAGGLFSRRCPSHFGRSWPRWRPRPGSDHAEHEGEKLLDKAARLAGDPLLIIVFLG